MPKRPLALSASAVLSAAFLLLAPAPAQAAYAVTNDFDCDGKADVVYADPYATVNGTQKAGLVVVRLSSSGSGLQVSQSSPGVPGASEDSDHFGMRVASFDQNSDGCADLLVSAPYEDLGSKNGAGQVWIIPGAVGGFDFSAAKTYTQDSAGFPGAVESGDGFGDSLTAGRTAAGQPFWAAGAPLDHYNDSIGGDTWGRGVVYYVRGGKARVIHYAKPGVPGAPHPDQNFGSELTSTPYHLIVGVPEMGISEYGAISVFGHTIVDGLPEPMGNFDQDSAGVTGGREEFDHFGATVDAVAYKPANAAPGSLVAVGAPEEDLGGDVDAGLVHVLFITKGGKVTEKMGVHQGLDGVWGTGGLNPYWANQMSLTTVGGVMGTASNSVLSVPPDQMWTDGSPTDQLFKVSRSPGQHDVVVRGGQFGLPQWNSLHDFACRHATPDGLLLAVRDWAEEQPQPVVYLVPWANIRQGANLPVWSWEPARTGPTQQNLQDCEQLL
ncbi:MAG: FG-GAP repeat protein [Micromonosporaceae bacterium]